MSFSLAPRPELGPEELAALVAAAEALLAEPVVRPAQTVAPAWRFSGRWFDAPPFTNRRPYRRH